MPEVTLTRRFDFCASHRYWNPNWSEEKNREIFGENTSPYGHGHNYVVEVTVSGPVDPETGMILNVRDLKRLVEPIIEELDHKFLNEDVPHFRSVQPTTENLAAYLFSRISEVLPQGIRLQSVRVYESEDLWAEYRANPGAILGRRRRFFSAHRLAVSGKSEEENYRIFGKCANPRGHGHEYILEVQLQGPIDPETGFVFPLQRLDALLSRLIGRWHMRRLDLEVPEFRVRPPTGEIMALEALQRLKATLGARLRAITLWETPRNVFQVRP